MSIAEETYKTKTSFLLPFEKMHGLGNDFVILNNSHLDIEGEDAEQELCRSICDRNRGIGADGLIIIDNPHESEEAIKSWRYYNADGSIGEMCGNGIRCAALYIYEHGLSGEETDFKIETLAGDIGVSLKEGELVTVNMGSPREIIEKQSIVIPAFENNPKNEKNEETSFNYDYVSMGNPHAISFYSNISRDELSDIAQIGPRIEKHENFPNKTNVEFALKTSENYFELIVWERGCGFTQACGTGACATVVAAIKNNLAKQDTDVTVKLPGGELIINWDSVTGNIFMTGPAKLSFLGYYNEER